MTNPNKLKAGATALALGITLNALAQTYDHNTVAPHARYRVMPSSPEKPETSAECHVPDLIQPPTVTTIWRSELLPAGDNLWTATRQNNPGIANTTTGEQTVYHLDKLALTANKIADPTRIPTNSQVLEMPIMAASHPLKTETCTSETAKIDQFRDTISQFAINNAAIFDLTGNQGQSPYFRAVKVEVEGHNWLRSEVDFAAVASQNNFIPDITNPIKVEVSESYASSGGIIETSSATVQTDNEGHETVSVYPSPRKNPIDISRALSGYAVLKPSYVANQAQAVEIAAEWLEQATPTVTSPPNSLR